MSYQHIAEWKLLCTACNVPVNAVIKMNTSTGFYYGCYSHNYCKLPLPLPTRMVKEVGKDCFTLDMLRDRFDDEGFELVP
jgi:hypothetical protein